MKNTFKAAGAAGSFTTHLLDSIKGSCIFVAVFFILATTAGQADDYEIAAPIPKADVLADLTLLAQVQGAVDVIVGLDTAFLPEGRLPASQRQAQRAAIAAAQNGLGNRLLGLNAQELRRFRSIPFVALRVGPAALQALAQDPRVVSITEDHVAEPVMDSSNPVIGSPTAWADGWDGAGQAVVVLDTGVDSTHPWFAGKLVSEACYSTNTAGVRESLCPGGVTSSVSPGSGAHCTGVDGCDHGTHVAGSAVGNDGIGPRYGVARGADLIAMQVFTRVLDAGLCGGTAPCVLNYTSDLNAALERVLELSASIDIAAVNVSLGGGGYTSQASCDSNNPSTKAAIDNLLSVGIPTIISAGNNGYINGTSQPGCISSAVTTGATTDGDLVASFSNIANFIDLLAPGVSVLSAVPGGGVASKQGTSMAAPHVAGAHAVLRQYAPDAPAMELLDALVNSGTPVDDTRGGGLVTGMPRINVDLALQQLGNLPQLSGQVTDGADPIPGVQLDLWNSNGEYLLSTATDGSGNYAFTVPGDGDYYVFTPVYGIPLPYLPEVWTDGGGTWCDFQVCDIPTTGTAITVSGADVTGIDLALETGFTISGTVREAGSNAPLEGPGVCVHRLSGEWTGACGGTNVNGDYTTTALPAGGDYVAYVNPDDQGYQRQVYDGLDCPLNQCDFGVGTAIPLGPDAIGIDFSVSPTSQLSGVISSSLTGLPLGQNEGRARIYNAAGELLAAPLTSASGEWLAAALPPDTYYVLATPRNGNLIDELHTNDGVGAQCPRLSCDFAALGTPIVVTGGEELTGLDVELDPGSQIGGMLTADGAPVAFGSLFVFDGSGTFLAFGFSDNSGAWNTLSGLPAGNYYVASRYVNDPAGNADYFPVAWPNVLCGEPCDPTVGEPIALNGNDGVGGVNFNLVTDNGQPPVSGTVSVFDGAGTVAATGEVDILVLTPAGEYVANAPVAADGSWLLPLPPGDYLIAATPQTPGAYQQYVAEFNDGTQTPYNSARGLFSLGVNFGAVAPVAIAGPTVVDITLELGVTVSGRLTDENTGVPIEGGVVTTNRPAFDLELSYGFTDANGDFIVAAFPAEDFKLFHSGYNVGYGREIGGVNKCLRDGPGGCDGAIAASSVISPAAGDALNTDVDLVRRIVISGQVTDEFANPVGGVPVNLRVADDGYVAATVWTDGGGNWAVDHVAPGSYYVTARGEDQGLVGQVYNTGGSNDCPFESCDYATLGSLVENFDGVDKGGVNFVLRAPQFATVSGSIRDANGEPTPGGAVSFVDPFGGVYREAWVDGEGNFIFDLPDGTYYAMTRYTYNVIDDLWDGVDGTPCPNLLCDAPTEGAPIVVSGGAAVNGIDFLLDFIPDGGRRIRGSVADGSLNPLVDAGLVLLNSEGTYLREFRTDKNGQFDSGPLAGDDYYLHTKGEETGLARELWSGGEPNFICSPLYLCDDPAVVTANGQLIGVAGGDANGIDFVLDSPDPAFAISGQVTGDGVGLPDVGIELFDEFGNWWSGRQTDVNGNYFFYGLEGDGRSYRVRVNGPPPGYDFELYNDVACPDLNCDPAGEGTPVAIGSTGVDMELPYAGGTRFFGTVFNLDTGRGVSSSVGFMGVQLWDAAGNLVATTSTNAAGQYSFILSDHGLGPGDYYLVTTQDQSYHGLVNEVMILDGVGNADGIPCFSDCNPVNVGGTLLGILEGESWQLDFFLEPALAIRGRVTDGVDPIPSVQLDAWDAAGNYVASGATDGNGEYFLPLPANGDYYVFTPVYGIPLPYLPEVWTDGGGTWCDFQVCEILTTGTPVTVSGADVTGIDLSLQTGFTISGTVREASGNTPVEGPDVCVHRLSGEWTGSCGGTDVNGEYTTTALPAGSDYVAYVIPDDLGYQRQMYDGLDCPNNACDFSAANAIELGNPGDAAGIDFNVTVASRLSGVISSSETGLPLGETEGRARIYDDTGNVVITALTDAAGAWDVIGLPPGTYYVLAASRFGYLMDELYTDGGAGAHCPRLACDFAALGTPVVIAGSEQILGLDVELDPGSRIAGSLTADGAPLAFGQLLIFDATGAYAGFGRADESGFWQSGSGLPAGDYFVASRWEGDPTLNAEYFPVAWPNRYCGEPCDPLAGLPVTVNGADSAGGIDFDLVSQATGSRILSGTVTNEEGGAPIFDVKVCAASLSDLSAEYCTITDVGGTYALFGLQELTDIVAWTEDVGGQAFYPEVYDGQPCCDPAGGTPIDLSAGNAVVDFQLAPSGLIAGRVTDVTTGQGLGGVVMQLFDQDCDAVDVIQTFTNEGPGEDLGRYAISGVPDGVYYLYANAELRDFASELYPDVKRINICYGELEAGQAILIENRTQVSSVDFALDPGGAIAGTISDASGLLPAGRGQVFIYDDTRTPIRTYLNLEQDQSYLIRGLPAGSYTLVHTSRFEGLVGELYDDVTCPRGSCDLGLATPVEVGVGERVTGIDAVLEPGSVIRGRLTDAATGDPLNSQFLTVYTDEGVFATVARSGADGFYETLSAVPAGQYFVSNQLVTETEAVEVANGFLPQAWTSDGSFGACGDPCDALSGDPIVVDGVDAAEGVDLAMQSGSTLSGSLQASSLPVQGAGVALYDATGEQIRSAETDASGFYRFTSLGSGDYYVRTFNGQGYTDRLHALPSDIVCAPNCAVLGGSPVAVAPATDVAGIDFDLDLAASISGRVTDGAGSGLAGITVEAYDPQVALVSTAITNPDGNYTLKGLGAGETFLRTRNSRGLLDRLYGGAVCAGDCDPRDGTPVVIDGALGNVAGADIALTAGGAIAGTVTAEVEGVATPLANVQVTVWNSSGRTAGNTFTDANGRYVIEGLSGGEYYLKTFVRSSNYVDVVADSSPCLGCNLFESATVAVVGGTVTDLDLALPFGQPLYVRLRDTAGNFVRSTPRQSADVFVIAHDEAGNEVRRATVPAVALKGVPANPDDGLPAYNVIVPALPPGVYYVKTENTRNFQDEIYDDVPCYAPCSAAEGTPVTITPEPLPSPLDIVLAVSNTIGGVVSVAGTDPAQGAQGVTVQLFTDTGQLLQSRVTGADGAYAFGGLPNGDYRVRTAGNHAYIDRVFGGDACAPLACDILGGELLELVNADRSDVDLALSSGSEVVGYARDTGGRPIFGFAELYSELGDLLDRVSVSDSNDGRFVFRGVADGTYFVYFDAVAQYRSNYYCYDSKTYYHSTSLTTGHWHYRTYCYDNYYYTTGIDTLASATSCPNRSCDITTGTPVTVGGGAASALGAGQVAAVSGVTTLELTTARGYNIRGSVRDYLDRPVPFTPVYFFDSNGFPVDEALTDGEGEFVSRNGLPDGTYFAATSRAATGNDEAAEAIDAEDGVGQGLQDEAWSGFACTDGPCAPSLASGQGTPFVIAGADATGIDFVLGQAAAIGLETLTNGVDADSPNAGDAPRVPPGETVTWTYRLSNIGGNDLVNVLVTDDQSLAVSCPATTLASGDTMDCTASAPAANLAAEPFDGVIGNCAGVPNSRLYRNVGSVSAETAGGAQVSDEDSSHYCNAAPQGDVIFSDNFE